MKKENLRSYGSGSGGEIGCMLRSFIFYEFAVLSRHIWVYC
jgi:hypothetical protein